MEEILQVSDPVLEEGLYVSSPGLYRKRKQKKLSPYDPSIVRYFSRMCTKATPFGLSAQCSTVEWATDGAEIRLGNLCKFIRLDARVLTSIQRLLCQDRQLRACFSYFSNNTSYKLGTEIRFIKQAENNFNVVYSTDSVLEDEVLALVMNVSRNGAHFSKLVSHLTNAFQVSEQEASEYLHELIDNQLLVSELTFQQNDSNYLESLIEKLEWVSNPPEKVANQLLPSLRSIQRVLKEYQNKSIENINLHIEPPLHSIGVNFDQDNIIHVTSYYHPKRPNTLNQNVLQSIELALQFLNQIPLPSNNPVLQSFAQRFEKRYGNQIRPLLEVLDPESGVGYQLHDLNPPTPITEGLSIDQSKIEEDHFSWNNVNTWLWEKLQAAIYGGEHEVLVKPDDVLQFKQDWKDTNSCLSVIFRMASDSNNNKLIYLENVANHGLLFISRFAQDFPPIYHIGQQIVNTEKSLNPDVILAEVSYVPENRSGNIITHPPFYDYDIPFLSLSSRPSDKRLDPNDLWVQVIDGHVYLISKKLDKQVIPQLCSAHNYILSDLPIYQFLGDLQNQGIRSIKKFSWGPWETRFKFLPRVRLQNVILYPATWHLSPQDLLPSAQKNTSPDLRELKAAFHKWKVPTQFMVVDAYNELFIDQENDLLLNIFWDTVGNQKSFIIKEWLIDTDSTVKDAKHRSYAHQFIVPLVRTQKTDWPVPNLSSISWLAEEVQRTFVPGNEWVYFKIYCGTKVADSIVSTELYDFINCLNADHIIEQWFFVRYSDPEHHIRLRLKLKNPGYYNVAARKLSQVLQAFIDSGQVYRIQLDTYQRELERYYPTLIEEAETIFYHDSTATLKVLRYLHEEEKGGFRWLYALQSIDRLLEDFDFDLRTKIDLLGELKGAYGEEFRVGKTIHKQLNAKYRQYHSLIAQGIPVDGAKDAESDITDEALAIRTRNSELAINMIIKECGQKDEYCLKDLLKSYMHMLTNRIFASDQRLHEMIIYDLLYQHYRSIYFKIKNTVIK